MTENQPKAGLIPWPPLIYIAAIAISIALGLLYPLPWIGDLLGDILFAAGWVALFGVAALWFTAIRTMIRAKTTLNPNAVPDHLVTTGPFGITRNPMYLGFLLILAGWAAARANVLAFLALPAFVLYMNQFQIKPEERALMSIFGDEFKAYCSTVRRWI